MEITKEKAAQIQAAKGVPITGPGVYEARVVSCNPYRSVKASGVTQVAIANFALTNEYLSNKAQALFKQGNFREAAKPGMSLSILEGQYCPVQGEMMKVTVELVHLGPKDDRPATVALLATRAIPVPAVKQPGISVDDWMAKVEGVSEVNEVSMIADEVSENKYEYAG